MKLGIASGDRITASKASDGNPHWGGAGWVRLGQYIPYFEEWGTEVHLGNLAWRHDRFVIDVSEGDKVFVDCDVIYIQRLMHDTLGDHIRKARANGQVVINDLDDWYWGLSTNNAAFLSSHPKKNPKENVNHYKGVLNASSAVTVSTPYLAERISVFVRRPIELFPNTVDVKRFNVVEHTDSDVPVVGWVGSTAHRSGDLEILDGIIKPMYDAGEIKVQHSGHHEHSSRTLAQAWSLDKEDVILKRAVDPEKYPTLLTMDIGVAPLSDVPFNHAKSEIKLLEYSASGIPWVASDLTAYRTLSDDWGAGRLAKKPKQWLKHLRELRDPDVRREEGKLLRERVWERDIAIGASILHSYITSLEP
jgi:glycosyltransferase involved in cell wall biosynthesis